MTSSGGVLKLVNKYLVQAKKLDKVEPVIAYYCRLHAAQVAMKMRKSKADEAVAGELISWCEQHKAVIAGLSKEDARARVETFALEVFASADAEDRSGDITAKTATTFFAAYVFMDTCHQFGELAMDIEQKIKYAAWKATDINRALKEGRTPKPGGVDDGGGDDMGDIGGGGGGEEEEGLNRNDGFSSPASGAGGATGSRGPASRATGASAGSSGGFVAGGGSGGDFDSLPLPKSAGGGGAAGKGVSWQDDEDMKAAARYAATLPSAPADSDEEKGPADVWGAPGSGHPSVFPVDGPGKGGLPSSYLPSSPLPPPVPPQPTSHETARAFGFTVDGTNAAAPQAYSPGFTGPVVPRPSLPSPASASSASSGPVVPPSSSRYSPAPPSMIGPSALPSVMGKSKVQAAKEADRLMKHAASALSFDDVDTCIVKLQQAVALLHPHKSQ